MVFSLLAALALQPDAAMLRRIFEESLARREKEYGAADARTAQAARDLGLFLSGEGQAPEARDALAEAVRIDEKAFGPGAPQTLADIAELAAVSPPEKAGPLWQRAAESSDAAVASRALASLGDLHQSRGDRAGATRLYRRALAKEEAAGGRDGARVAVRLNALAVVLSPDEGIPLLRRALAINRRVLGARHPETATTQANLAGLLLNTGRTDEAIRTAANALSVFEETLGPGHPRTASASTVLAHALRAKGDREGAERLYRRALAIDEQAYGSRHPETLDDVRNLAEFLREVGRVREAGELERRLAVSGAR